MQAAADDRLVSMEGGFLTYASTKRQNFSAQISGQSVGSGLEIAPLHR
jgi:hypothetical protein